MPELQGVRSLDDIIDGHRANGRFAPGCWQYGQIPAQPDAAAVLLLEAIPEKDAWEIAYLGLTPTARGRGLGRIAIGHAIELARPRASRLQLAVDIRNHPATRLYDAVGFVPFDRRSVHMVVFSENSKLTDIFSQRVSEAT
jgi:GNAT superfamily N-acetyltransferase